MSKEKIDDEITNEEIKLKIKTVNTKKKQDQIKTSNLQKDNNKKEYEDIKISDELFNKKITIDGLFGVETINNEEKIEVSSQNKSNQHNPQKIKIEESNNFPRDSKYEKELNSNFKYFNVFWFDPNKTNDYNLFEKCFENVQFHQSDDINSMINFFEKETILEWIIISNGTQVKELVQNLENNNCIKSFFIYCPDKKLHESWAKYKKVRCITSNPKELCEKLIELNNSYYIPNFNYKRKINNIEVLSDDKIYSDILFLSKSYIIEELLESKRQIKEKYYKLCIKIIHYLVGDEDSKNFKDANFEGNSSLALTLNKLIRNKSVIESYSKNLLNLIIVSLYFHKYPYIFNVLSFEEVKAHFEEEADFFMMMKQESDLNLILENLSRKIMNNECVLDYRDEIKKINIYTIYLVTFGYKLIGLNITYLDKCYQVINFWRDIDFCLKLLVSDKFSLFKNEKFSFHDEINMTLIVSDERYPIYNIYLEMLSKKSLPLNSNNNFTEEDKKIINNSLKIKDFIIIEEENFHEKINVLEKYIDIKSLKYLKIGEISKYVHDNLKQGGSKTAKYFYFLIIRLQEFQENFVELVKLSVKSGISFMVFIYVENENIMYFHKDQINLLMSTILVYSPEDIISYLTQQFDFINPLNSIETKELAEALDIEIPKISFIQNDEDKFQNGCFELAETFDINLIKNKLVFRFFGEINYMSEFSKYIYDIYKEHNSLDIFFSQNCSYFGWKLYPDLIDNSFSYARRILYMYCREESPSEKSLYRIMNDDLRTRDPYKIYRYINLLALINELIEGEILESFEGYVYRATKLDENLIMKLVPNTIMINTTFWSTSKDFNIADKFMKNQQWRNSFIVCKTVKNNIDIESENLNPYNEKEVLFLPFNEFRVEKISSEIKYGKKIFTIELTDLGNRNVINSDNMQVENIKNLGMKKVLGNLLKNDGEELE